MSEHLGSKLGKLLDGVNVKDVVNIVVAAFVVFWIGAEINENRREVAKTAEKVAEKVVKSEAVPLPWAIISQFHARWLPDKGRVQLSIVLNRRQDCSRVIVTKVMRPVENNSVVTDQFIVLEGNLAEDMLAAPKGESVHFDFARPVTYPMPGHYLLTLIALCENPVDGEGGPQEVSQTEPRQAVIVVEPIEVRPVPKRT